MSPREGANELRAHVDQQAGVRIILYLNERRLDEYFVQRRENVTEALSGRELAAEVSGGYLSFVNAKVGGKSSRSEKIQITPLVRAILLEETGKECGGLVNLTDAKPISGHLLLYTGPGRIVGPWSAVTTDNMGDLFDARMVDKIQRYRTDQERKLAWGKPESPGTLVWAARGAECVAAIASYKFAMKDSFASYGDFPPFGILGLFESRMENVTMLSPLMIWHDSVKS